ncbi:MAG: hypothetical protein H0V69_08170 [Acidimicrobiia bacterium]|jgi:hypothetical protein|nr:hypothetical protein [Acidimicrobiia bacterium]MDQ3390956.1 hypothetical protein [Actinomycetota bacterium]
MEVLRSISVAALLYSVAACSEDNPRVVEGPAAADVANEAPYGPGVDVGEAYDYVLYVHCGVQWARIDGVWWETSPLDDGNANPPKGWGNPYDAGTMALIDDDTAEYTGGTGVAVRFARTELIEAPFECE